jgi:hypothetical protein
MAFLSRLFKRDDPLAEREEARRQGMRDARQHPLGEFTDPEFQPAYVTEVRARARERITEVDRRLAATRSSLLGRAVGARETILRELARADLRPLPEDLQPLPERANGHAADSPSEEDPFISIAEARWRRAEARRRGVVREAGDTVHAARAQIEQLTQEWESALIERNHAVETVHARAEQLIAAYRGGVMRAHPRREEIPSLWKGEVIAMDSSVESATAVSGREEIGRIMEEVEARIDVWHTEVVARPMPGENRPLGVGEEQRRSLPQEATPDSESGAGAGPDAEAEPASERGPAAEREGEESDEEGAR